MTDYISSLGIIILLMKQMQSTVVGLRHLRESVPADIGAELLDPVIAEGEARLADAQRKLAPYGVGLRRKC
jgi:hypothetical protein